MHIVLTIHLFFLEIVRHFVPYFMFRVTLLYYSDALIPEPSHLSRSH